MDAADVLAKLYERGNALEAFWGFYITVAIGIIAFWVRSESDRRSP